MQIPQRTQTEPLIYLDTYAYLVIHIYGGNNNNHRRVLLWFKNHNNFIRMVMSAALNDYLYIILYISFKWLWTSATKTTLRQTRTPKTIVSLCLCDFEPQSINWPANIFQFDLLLLFRKNDFMKRFSSVGFFIFWSWGIRPLYKMLYILVDRGHM